MHIFCRFCLSPADKAISLEDLGATRLRSWALQNLGLEMNICPGFSTSVCWACVTTFQNWASMMQDRAACTGDEHLANQESWWEDIPSNSCLLFPSVGSPAASPLPATVEEVPADNEQPPPSQNDQATNFNTDPVPQSSVCAHDDEKIPVIEAIHTAVDTKNCSVIITALSNEFILKSCQGLVKLNELAKNFPQVDDHLRCLKCNIVVENKACMVKHVAKLHTDTKICPYCVKTFEQKVDISKHITDHVCCKGESFRELFFFCPKCPEKCNEFSSLSAHFASRHSCGKLTDWTVPCWQCNYVYFERKQMMDHFQHSHHQSPCRFCNGSFKNNVALMDHISQTHPDTLYSYCYKIDPGGELLCIVCDAKFVDTTRISKHFVTYHEHLLPLLADPLEVRALAEQVQEQKCLLDEDTLFKVPVLPEPFMEEKVKDVKLDVTTSPTHSKFIVPAKPLLIYSKSTFRQLVKRSNQIESHISKPVKILPKGGLLEEPSDDVKETAKLVRTLTEALPKLVPALLQREPRQKMDLPTTADFAVTNTPAPVKQQAKKGGVESGKVDVALQSIKSILPVPPCRTVRSQTPDQVKSKNQVKSAAVGEPQPEECSLSNVERVSQKRKSEGEESSRTSKKFHSGRSEHTNKCKVCNKFETHYMYSLTRHVRLIHPKVYKCKECMQNFEIGLCERHLLKSNASAEKASKEAVKKLKTEDLKKSKKETPEKSKMDSLEKSRNDTLEKLKREKLEKLRKCALEMHLKCPGCKITLVGATQLKAHASSCIKLSEEQKYCIRKSSVIELARARKEFKAKCKICKKSFYNHGTLARHNKSIHQQSDMFSCDKCSYMSSRMKNLQAHIIRIHEKVDIHKVNKVKMLNKIYKPAQNSSKRLFGEISDGKAEEKELECQFCYSTFANLESMELHCLKMHPTSFRFVCRLCPERKRFMFQASLDKHIESAHPQSGFHHLGEETTSSPDSGPVVSNDHSYASPTDKKSEELLHSEDTNSDVEWGKMSKCESCDKMFADEVTKKMHFRVFHERKSDPLPCIICNQIFASKVVLKIHLANCRGPKKQKARPSEDGNTSTTTIKSPDDGKGSVIPKTIFTCSICKVPFDNLTDHNLHLVNVHSSKLTPDRSAGTATESPEASAPVKSAKQKIKLIVYRCNQCTEVFVSKNSVLKHLQSKHGASNVIFRSENRL